MCASTIPFSLYFVGGPALRATALSSATQNKSEKEKVRARNFLLHFHFPLSGPLFLLVSFYNRSGQGNEKEKGS